MTATYNDRRANFTGTDGQTHAGQWSYNGDTQAWDILVRDLGPITLMEETRYALRLALVGLDSGAGHVARGIAKAKIEALLSKLGA